MKLNFICIFELYLYFSRFEWWQPGYKVYIYIVYPWCKPGYKIYIVYPWWKPGYKVYIVYPWWKPGYKVYIVYPWWKPGYKVYIVYPWCKPGYKVYSVYPWWKPGFKEYILYIPDGCHGIKYIYCISPVLLPDITLRPWSSFSVINKAYIHIFKT